MNLTNNSFIEKYELGNKILNFYLPYREDLNFSSNITFGFELEFANAKCKQVRDELFENNLEKFETIFESSVSYFDKYNNIVGGEVRSPVLKFDKNTFSDVKKVCDILKFCLGEVDDLTAGHIHIGSQIFENNEDINNFLFMWAVFEDIIKRFLAGEFLNTKINSKYAEVCSKEIFNSCFDIKKLLLNRTKQKRDAKTYALSFKDFKSFNTEKDNTIEIRDIKGSLEAEIWQNNINFLISLINFSKNLTKEEKAIIKEKFQNDKLGFDYEFINYDKALYLADCIFTKQIDKLCFLKQYFKDFYLYDGEVEKVKLVRKK